MQFQEQNPGINCVRRCGCYWVYCNGCCNSCENPKYTTSNKSTFLPPLSFNYTSSTTSITEKRGEEVYFNI